GLWSPPVCGPLRFVVPSGLWSPPVCGPLRFVVPSDLSSRLRCLVIPRLDRGIQGITLAPHAYPPPFQRSPPGLVRPPRPQAPALAGGSQPLPCMGERDHAAADPGGHRHPLLRTLHAALPHRRSPGGGGGRRGSAPLDRP